MMNVRCYDSTHKAYHRYGGRGIDVCESWRWNNNLGFFNFINDVGDRPIGFTLDKIDNNFGYYKHNVRWADKRTQQNNLGKGLSNTSGYVGVKVTKDKCESIILINGKAKILGTFNLSDIEAAHDMYEKVKMFKLEHTDDETSAFIDSLLNYSPTEKRLRINKTSNYYGVSWDKSRSKWRAMTSYRETEHGKLINKMVGRFDYEIEAYEAMIKFLDWIKINGFYKKLANRKLMK